MKKIISLIICFLFISFPAWGADYTTHKKIDGLADVSGAVTALTLVPVQDMGDTDKIGSASIQQIVDKGLEAAGPIGGTTPGIIRSTKQRYYPATLSDATTPHQLTVAECSNTLITTQGWNGTADIQFGLPDISAYDGTEGVLSVKFLDSKGMQDADTDMYVDPDASTQVVLDGTPTGTDGHRVWWDDIVIYSGMVCHSDYDPTLGGYWVCDSLNGLAADKGS